MAISSASIDSPSPTASIGGNPNSTDTSAPARVDRSVAMRARTASALLKRVALSELRYNLSDLDSINAGDSHGTCKVAVATHGLPCASSQLSS